MSLMCKMSNSCSATKGMCIHEKMMMMVMVLIAVPVLGHFVFRWF